MRIHSIFAFAFAALSLTGCAIQSAHDAGDGTADDSADEISKTKDSFVTLRADMRKCLAPLCGGYYVKTANGTKTETYVSGFDFSVSGLSDADQAKVAEAPAGELVIKGHLGKADSKYHVSKLVVVEAYRGMPGMVAGDGETFYQASDRTPAIECFVAPCNNEIGTTLNKKGSFDFTRLSVDRAAFGFVDKAWLAGRVLRHGAIVSANLVDGDKLAGGAEKVLDASQVFIRIPDSIGPCPKGPEVLCAMGLERAYTRNADRCEVFAGCVKPAICPLFMPACQPGYSLVSWEGTSGCKQYTCDPTFVTE